MATRLLRALVATTALVIATSGMAHAGETDDPTVGAPTVGACYDLTYKQGFAESVPVAPVDCSTTHTAVVARIGELPSSLTWSSPKAKIGNAVGDQCGRALDARIGSNPVLIALSAYNWMWFEPSEAEQEAGARWFSCVIVAPEDNALTDLPDPLPRLSKHLPDELSRCFVGRKYLSTTCADRHDWRVTFAVLVRQKVTRTSFYRASQRFCPAHVTSRTWVPTYSSAKARSFVLSCSSKTHR